MLSTLFFTIAQEALIQLCGAKANNWLQLFLSQDISKDKLMKSILSDVEFNTFDSAFSRNMFILTSFFNSPRLDIYTEKKITVDYVHEKFICQEAYLIADNDKDDYLQCLCIAEMPFNTNVIIWEIKRVHKSYFQKYNWIF